MLLSMKAGFVLMVSAMTGAGEAVSPAKEFKDTVNLKTIPGGTPNDIFRRAGADLSKAMTEARKGASGQRIRTRKQSRRVEAGGV